MGGEGDTTPIAFLYDFTLTLDLTTGDPDVALSFSATCVDAESVNTFGYRPRSAPFVIGEARDTQPPSGFMPDLTDLTAELQAELARYATPIPAFAVERACDTADHRADILARRLSDKVHLTADGPSMLGFDGDCFIEAIQTTIRPTGELTQTLWIEEGPPPEAPTDAPTGFTVTRNSATRATLAWDAGTIGAARFNVYRGDAANSLTLLAGDVGSGATVEYIDNTISSPNGYWYAVAAENNGGEGPQTAAMRAGWPQQPTGFDVFRLNNQSLLLFWDNPNDADITGYRVWRGTSVEQHQHRDRKQRGECQHHAIHQ